MKAYHGAITTFLGTQGAGSTTLDYNDAVWSAAALCSSDAASAQVHKEVRLTEMIRNYWIACN